MLTDALTPEVESDALILQGQFLNLRELTAAVKRVRPITVSADPELAAQLQKSVRGEYELTDAIRAMACNGIKVQGYEIKNQWADVRDPSVLANLNQQEAT